MAHVSAGEYSGPSDKTVQRGGSSFVASAADSYDESRLRDAIASWFSWDDQVGDELFHLVVTASHAVLEGGSIINAASRRMHHWRSVFAQEQSAACISDVVDKNNSQLTSPLGLKMLTKTSSTDLVTNVDVEVESCIREILLGAFPEYGFLGEEGSSNFKDPTGNFQPFDSQYLENESEPNACFNGWTIGDRPTWIVDPLDGTTNFISGIPFYCTSVALFSKKVTVLAAVYNPCLHDLYVAVRGRGAVVNGCRIYPSAKTDVTEAIVITELGYERSRHGIDLMCDALRRILQPHVRAVRMLGSGILDLLYVAEGRADAVYAGVAGEGWQPWDHAAGVLIAQEAGASVVSLQNETSRNCSVGGVTMETFSIFGTSVLCACTASLCETLRGILVHSSS